MRTSIALSCLVLLFVFDTVLSSPSKTGIVDPSESFYKTDCLPAAERFAKEYIKGKGWKGSLSVTLKNCNEVDIYGSKIIVDVSAQLKDKPDGRIVSGVNCRNVKLKKGQYIPDGGINIVPKWDVQGTPDCTEMSHVDPSEPFYKTDCIPATNQFAKQFTTEYFKKKGWKGHFNLKVTRNMCIKEDMHGRILIVDVSAQMKDKPDGVNCRNIHLKKQGTISPAWIVQGTPDCTDLDH